MISYETLKNRPYFGKSRILEKAKRYLNIAASAHCAVLILGETGTGKGVAARWIHYHSPRKHGAFVDINCSGLSGSLLKSELFGHARGAFTGAISDHAGLIEAANGGTLFLDEIGDIDIDVQCQLLKAVEEKQYRRLGENGRRNSDFRLICATNHNLFEAMERGAFKKDLYYRINTLTIGLPPLLAHKDDIPELLNYMLANMGYNRFPVNEGVINLLMRHRWHGNIREFRNAIERALVFAQDGVLTTDHFSDLVENEPSNTTRADDEQTNDVWNLDNIEKKHILYALEHFGGDKIKTSEALGISLASLYRKLKQNIKSKNP